MSPYPSPHQPPSPFIPSPPLSGNYRAPALLLFLTSPPSDSLILLRPASLFRSSTCHSRLFPTTEVTNLQPSSIANALSPLVPIHASATDPTPPSPSPPVPEHQAHSPLPYYYAVNFSATSFYHRPSRLHLQARRHLPCLLHHIDVSSGRHQSIVFFSTFGQMYTGLSSSLPQQSLPSHPSQCHP